MEPIVQKNESYSELMLTEGATTTVDEDFHYEIKLPDWADSKKVKMGQRFGFLNLNALSHATFLGLLAVIPVETLTQVLIFTKQSSTPALSYRRFKANGLHLQTWYRNPMETGSIAWQSISTIRRMHVVVNKRSTKAGVGIISQKDMAVTQFLFMGFAMLMPETFGFVGCYEQFDAFNHLWRLIGYLLGTADRFNCCGETVEETRRRLQSIKEDMLLPAWKDPFPGCMEYARITFEGVSTSFPTMEYESSMFMMKKAVGVPGYNLFDSKQNDKNVFHDLSLYAKFQIFLEFVIYEHFSHIFVFRWIFNIFRIMVALLEFYPILAIYRFGRKYAFVEIMKPKKYN
ncbi:hypothetical protein Bhyg_01801 [Pseudolycoriella hygida]|uniref:ER-bound oxygenase mpaB/mpaB'/Rubber oxygenase catalytic domain-containing protein n=1 Tax=Pseudolycoriella hygida TaxID=35572 RepID=A0A9Q0NAL4_9DIPT|nr:hypothetical protein Bhyg_01801 [Pseudolycoriella hygida]